MYAMEHAGFQSCTIDSAAAAADFDPIAAANSNNTTTLSAILSDSAPGAAALHMHKPSAPLMLSYGGGLSSSSGGGPCDPVLNSSLSSIELDNLCHNLLAGVGGGVGDLAPQRNLSNASSFTAALQALAYDDGASAGSRTPEVAPSYIDTASVDGLSFAASPAPDSPGAAMHPYGGGTAAATTTTTTTTTEPGVAASTLAAAMSTAVTPQKTPLTSLPYGCDSQTLHELLQKLEEHQQQELLLQELLQEQEALQQQQPQQQPQHDEPWQQQPQWQPQPQPQWQPQPQPQPQPYMGQTITLGTSHTHVPVVADRRAPAAPPKARKASRKASRKAAPKARKASRKAPPKARKASSKAARAARASAARQAAAIASAAAPAPQRIAPGNAGPAGQTCSERRPHHTATLQLRVTRLEMVQPLKVGEQDPHRNFDGRRLPAGQRRAPVVVRIPRKATNNRPPQLPLKMSLIKHYRKLQKTLREEWAATKLRPSYVIELLFEQEEVRRRYEDYAATYLSDRPCLELSGELVWPEDAGLDASVGYDLFALVKKREAQARNRNDAHMDEFRLQWRVTDGSQ